MTRGSLRLPGLTLLALLAACEAHVVELATGGGSDTQILVSGAIPKRAIDQFSREEVLFREAERFEVRLWLRHLLRDKEPTPSFTEAGFCFALIMLLQFAALKHLQEAIVTVGIMRTLMMQSGRFVR